MRERGLVRRDACVTRKREIQSPTETKSTNRRDYPYAGMRHGVHRALAAASEFKTGAAIERGDLGDFSPGGEGFVCASDNASTQMRFAREAKRFPLE
jgi:hypothetical protein